MLTDGLKRFAGAALERALARFTGTPLKAFGSGALVTMLVQSSSATTVTLIGFVSAGLVTFPQALGVVLGASLGTTATGWIVAWLGLKFSVGLYALPLVGAGALLQLFGRGRARPLGLALAGFGLIFLGIQTLQDGMAALAGWFDLARLPAAGLAGHALAMGVGLVMTVVMQSSSAAVATTLTALHAGAVNFEQAASIVVGAAIGTTVTGALAALGGSIPARRTAAAHVIFNLATGLVAIVLLPLFLQALAGAQARGWIEPGATSLVVFHSAFIALGCALFLPWLATFGRWIERLVPERAPALTRYLDASVIEAPAAAVTASRRALTDIAAELFSRLAAVLGPGRPLPGAGAGEDLRTALEAVRNFLGRLPPAGDDAASSSDHLLRLRERVPPPPALRDRPVPEGLAAGVERSRRLLEAARHGLTAGAAGAWLDAVASEAAALAEWRRAQRPVVLRRTALGAAAADESLHLLDAMRWLDRVGYHAWRVAHHLGAPLPEAAKAAGRAED
ncbi:MAG TPA: Na/Pi symporter [Verrucomicrobiota bacterium]|nr:Na/Pi symporter [Verrucomicrobiota bacterium]